MLKITNLNVQASDKTILNDFNLTINDGEIHVIMGPNGAGKSTICKAIFNHPDYTINGNITYNNHNLVGTTPTDISRLGIFLLNQNPTEIEGITNAELIRNALSAKTGKPIDIFEFNKKLNEVCDIIKLPKSFVHRDINFNMSGGEKKKNELLSLFMLEPSFIMLDEIDSGLDIDALKVVGQALSKYYAMYKPSMLIITHHPDLLKYFPDYQVHILKDGHIISSGDKSLVNKIETSGFEANVISRSKQNE